MHNMTPFFGPLTPFRRSLLALSIMGLTQPAALAQEAEIAGEQQSGESIEEIVVTGSRIRREDLESHSPLVGFDAEEIQRTGIVDISELINQLPSMVPSGGVETSNFNGYAGLSRLNLRGLGSTRTLVLVNGRRHVPSVPGSSEVDVSSIPTALIKRVDVMTGGASSIYGADAVSGVINIILKEDFTGTEFSSSYNTTGENDGQRWYGQLTHGQEFEDGKGHFNFHVSYQTSDPVEARTRDYVANDLMFVDNPAAGEAGQPLYVTANRSPLYSTSQRIFLMDGRPYGINGDGSLKEMLADGQSVYGYSENITQLAALTTDTGNGDFYTRYEWGRLAVPIDRLNTAFNLNRELTDSIELFAELKYVTTESESRTEPLAEYGVTPLPTDYAFYTEEQRAEVTATGQGLLFGGYFPELGRQGLDYEYNLYQAVVALEGLTSSDYRWQLSAQHGQTEVDITSINDYSQENWEKAVWGSFMDPNTYEVRTCGSDCVPINVFQPLTQEAINYLKIGPHTSNATLKGV